MVILDIRLGGSMPWAVCINKNCVYWDEKEEGKCQLDRIKITEDGECSDQEVEFRAI